MYHDRDPDVFRRSDAKVEGIMRQVTAEKERIATEKQKKIIREVLDEYGIKPSDNRNPFGFDRWHL